MNPYEVAAEIAQLLKEYRCSTVVGDNYAAKWVSDAFAKIGITYRKSDADRSAIYLNAFPLFTSGRARLLDIPRLVSQFAGLERRTFSTGRDRVDHGRTGHDDAANAAAGALTLAASRVEQIIPIVAPLTWSANRGWDDTPTPNNNGVPPHYLKANQPVDPGVAYAGAPSRGSRWGPI